MRAAPPPQLVELLGRLKLATPGQLRAAHRHARRLAKDLALFDSVWVDALVQARVLTPFQAARIEAGQAESLRVGPYSLLAPLSRSALGDCYRAREITTSRVVRLLVVQGSADAEKRSAEIKPLVDRTAKIATPHIVPIERCGVDDGRLWIVSACPAGRTAGQWLVRGGRMPPEVVLELARQVVAALTVCEASGFVHGDISAQQLVIDPLGLVRLLDAGLPSIIRPCEPHSSAQLPPEFADALAPELASRQQHVSVVTDIFSCGALWWHLLAGRPPFAGSSFDDRRRAACSTRIRDIYQIAPDTPQRLVEAITRSTEPAPEHRPAGFAELLDLLGPPSDRGQALLARYVARGASPPERLVRRIRTIRRSPNMPTWVAASAGVLLALTIGSWPLWTHLLVDEPAPANLPPVATVASPPKSSTNASASTASNKQSQPAVLASAAMVGQPPGPIKNSKIVRTSAIQPSAARAAPREQPAAISREFVLSAARPIPWSQVRPAPGQVVHSRAGERAQVVLPAAGATLATENVRFEDVDFIVAQSAASAAPLISIGAERATFLRCSWQVVLEAGRPPIAIDWQPKAQPTAGRPGETCHLELRECVLAGVGTGVRCAVPGAAMLDLTDVLFLGEDALVGIDQSGEALGQLHVKQTHCTIRGSRSAVDWQRAQSAAAEAALSIETTECVFDLPETGAVLTLLGDAPSAAALRALAWQGTGSLVSRKTPLVHQRGNDGQSRPLTEPRPILEGLLRTELGFAGAAAEGPDASRLVRWQVPLRSATPPGIGDMSLPLPKLR